MNCNEAEELLGAWSLHALTDDESEAMRAHLASCPEHATQAAELRFLAAAAMPSLADAVAPPPNLRARILDAVAVTPQEGLAVAPRAITSARSMGREDRLRWMRRVPAQVWFGAAAAAIAGLLIWNVALMSGDDSADVQEFARAATSVTPLQALAPGDIGSGAVVYFGDKKRAVIIGNGLPKLDQSQTYQMWAIEGDTPHSVGLMGVDASGNGTSVISYDAERFDAFAITIEPAGGSSQPTVDPIFDAEL